VLKEKISLYLTISQLVYNIEFIATKNINFFSFNYFNFFKYRILYNCL